MRIFGSDLADLGASNVFRDENYNDLPRLSWPELQGPTSLEDTETPGRGWEAELISPGPPPPPQDAVAPRRSAYPQPAPKDSDLAPSLLLALPPLHEVETIVNGQGDVPLAHGGVHGARQQVGLRLQCHLHAIGQQQPQGAIRPDVVAVTHLVWGTGEAYAAQEVQGWRHGWTEVLSIPTMEANHYPRRRLGKSKGNSQSL